jgi:soluble lytic murein transglycosylase-like protein
MSGRPVMKLSARLLLGAVLYAVLLCPVALAGQMHRDRHATDTEALLRVVAKIYDLDPALLRAIAITESGGNPDAVSPKGAQGLMQLMPTTAERFGVIDPFDPVENVLGAARFLKQLELWRASTPDLVHLPELIAAYNAGPGAVEKYGGLPPYPETRQYVRRVLWLYFLGRLPPRATEAGAIRATAVGSPVSRKSRRAARQSGDLGLLEQLADIRRERAEALSRNLKHTSGSPHQ